MYCNLRIRCTRRSWEQKHLSVLPLLPYALLVLIKLFLGIILGNPSFRHKALSINLCSLKTKHCSVQDGALQYRSKRCFHEPSIRGDHRARPTRLLRLTQRGWDCAREAAKRLEKALDSNTKLPKQLTENTKKLAVEELLPHYAPFCDDQCCQEKQGIAPHREEESRNSTKDAPQRQSKLAARSNLGRNDPRGTRQLRRQEGSCNQQTRRAKPLN